MNFKDALDWEAEHVFLNPDEFAEAEPITLNNIPCNAVVIGPRTEQANDGDGRTGVYFETAVINFPAGLMPLPQADRSAIWNGEPWMVQSSSDNQGIFRIELYRERS